MRPPAVFPSSASPPFYRFGTYSFFPYWRVAPFAYASPFFGGWAWSGLGYLPGATPPVIDEATGGLRLKVEPRNAQVFVDGYYAGVVDDYDGYFQHLHLAPGPHHIELRATGYRSLAFDVNIQPHHTIEYRGALTPSGS